MSEFASVHMLPRRLVTAPSLTETFGELEYREINELYSVRHAICLSFMIRCLLLGSGTLKDCDRNLSDLNL